MSTVANFRPNMTLKEAQDALRGLVDEGHKCPCCTQFAKVYQRKIHTKMARDLIVVYRRAGGEWLHVQDAVGASAPDLVKTRYWGLLEAQEGVRDDGSRRVGIWRLTSAGQEFVLGRTTVSMYARIYDGRCLGLVGEQVGIRDALGKKFNYGELMAGQ